MTQIIVRIVSVALLSLILLAGSASAGCAWVVWERAEIHDPRNPEVVTYIYSIAGARGTEDECRQMSGWMNNLRKNPSIVMHYCLPDTVDPRGPSGR